MRNNSSEKDFSNHLNWLIWRVWRSSNIFQKKIFHPFSSLSLFIFSWSPRSSSLSISLSSFLPSLFSLHLCLLSCLLTFIVSSLLFVFSARLLFFSSYSSCRLLFFSSSRLPFFSSSRLFSQCWRRQTWMGWREGEDAVSQKKPLTFHNVSNFCFSLQFQEFFHMSSYVKMWKSAWNWSEKQKWTRCGKSTAPPPQPSHAKQHMKTRTCTHTPHNIQHMDHTPSLLSSLFSLLVSLVFTSSLFLSSLSPWDVVCDVVLCCVWECMWCLWCGLWCGVVDGRGVCLVCVLGVCVWCVPRRVLTCPREVHQRNFWILPISSLRIGPTRHVLASSNHPL